MGRSSIYSIYRYVNCAKKTNKQFISTNSDLVSHQRMSPTQLSEDKGWWILCHYSAINYLISYLTNTYIEYIVVPLNKKKISKIFHTGGFCAWGGGDLKSLLKSCGAFLRIWKKGLNNLTNPLQNLYCKQKTFFLE